MIPWTEHVAQQVAADRVERLRCDGKAWRLAVAAGDSRAARLSRPRAETGSAARLTRPRAETRTAARLTHGPGAIRTAVSSTASALLARVLRRDVHPTPQPQPCGC
jgi:hypothetical protein